MHIGYARTSTVDQVAGFEGQLRELEAAGCKKVFKEQVSSVAARPELDAVLAYLRDDDVLVVTKMDRLARSMRDLLNILDRVEAKGAALKIIGLGLDTSTPTAKLILQTLGAVGEFERTNMLERQKEGIAKAKADGKYRGRVPTAQRKAGQVRTLAASGKRPSAIARELGIGRSSVWRILQSKVAAQV